MGDFDFENKFLNKPSVQKDEPGVPELFNDFRKILRNKLAGYSGDVKWVNPVALLAYKHPGLFAGHSKATWEDILSKSLFCPVAIKANDQPEVDIAYLPITDPEVMNENHLTPSLKIHPITDLHGYKLEMNGTCSKIHISGCCNDTAVGDITGVKHYKGLFKLTPNVYFFPSPLISFTGARSDLYEEYFVGTYIGISTGARNVTCITLQNDALLREAITWATKLLFLRRLKDEGKEFIEVLAQYKKQMQMLRLLQEPLSNLSDALLATQEYTQKLRSILYDPHRTIFAASPNVILFFEQEGRVEFGTVKMESVHNAADKAFAETKDGRKTNNGKKLVAAIICTIFGVEKKKVTSQDKLFSEAKGVLDNEAAKLAPETDELASLCRGLINGNIFEQVENVEPYRAAFNVLKDVLFTPYKDGAPTKPLWPLLVLLYGNNQFVNVQVCGSNEGVSDNLASWHSQKKIHKNFFKGLELPVPRYSSFLSLISGVLAFAVSDSAKIKEVEIENTCDAKFRIDILFDKEIFTGDMPDTIKRMVSVIQDGVRPISIGNGNFHKPFYDFSEMCIGANVKSELIGKDVLLLTYSGTNSKKYEAKLNCVKSKFLFEIISVPTLIEQKQLVG